jgi:hypothetical protein
LYRKKGEEGRGEEGKKGRRILNAEGAKGSQRVQKNTKKNRLLMLQKKNWGIDLKTRPLETV